VPRFRKMLGRSQSAKQRGTRPRPPGAPGPEPRPSGDDGAPAEPIDKDLDKNESALRAALGDSMDLTFRRLRPDPEGRRLLLVYLRGSVDEVLLASNIIRPLTVPGLLAGGSGEAFIAALSERVVSVGTVNELSSLDQLVRGILGAHVGLIVDGSETALEVVTSAWPTRGVSEPDTEVTIRGPRDGFGAAILDDIALLRKAVRDPNLRFIRRHVGRRTNTVTVVAYIAGLAPQSLIDEVNRRLDHIDTDGILESGYIEEMIRDHRWSPFPMLFRTERPDRVAGCLLEGRVAILVDGTPFVLVMPATLSMFLTAADDWYEGFTMGTAMRLLRYFGFVISIALPALYVAITSFHHEMVPTPLVLSIANQRQGIPFPVLAEALFLQIMFELLREAGVRLPKAVGQAVTIVGALIIGQQAVEAGLVSPFMVIIIAITAIASFATPVYSMGLSIRLINPLMIIAGGTLGLFGIVIAAVVLVAYLASLNSFGVPYMSPVAPTRTEGLKDVLLQWPLWAPKRRPMLAPGADPITGALPSARKGAAGITSPSTPARPAGGQSTSNDDEWGASQ